MSIAVEDRLTTAAVNALRAAIADAGGNEVFLLGTLDDKGVRPSDHNFSTVSFYVH